MLHHVELYVADLPRSLEFWSWLLERLGYAPYQRWPQGASFIFGQTYIVFVQVEPGYAQPAYHRKRVGLNHLAFHAPSREFVDALRTELLARGVPLLYEERYPHAGGRQAYALFCEDPDRLKVEIVAA